VDIRPAFSAFAQFLIKARAEAVLQFQQMATEYKNIVVVGLSLSGAEFVKGLRKSGIPAGYRLVGIDATEFIFYPIAALRAAVVPGWEDKLFARPEAVLPEAPNHLLLTGTRVVSVGEKSVKLSKPHDAVGGDELPYEKLIIATVIHFFFSFFFPNYSWCFFRAQTTVFLVGLVLILPLSRR
jgi:NADPH-dependent 2,4-dienoyl-CoA reductase/sulfur reductase-like enzyme